MTTDRPPSAAELRGCAPWERNCATSAPEPATTHATTAQPGSLKAAAALVLQRNQARNTCATEAAQPRNSEPATEPPKVARAAGIVTLIEEPTTHCPACGSPSWWLSPDDWRCAYCDPRPAAFTGASLVIADAWADGRAPALDEEPGHPAEPEPVRPDNGRVKDLAGAWRSPEHHAARDAFYVHHDACPTCRRAGQRRGLARCEVGRALHSAYTLAALADRGGRA